MTAQQAVGRYSACRWLHGSNTAVAAHAVAALGSRGPGQDSAVTGADARGQDRAAAACGQQPVRGQDRAVTGADLPVPLLRVGSGPSWPRLLLVP
jgi:hypothetical protein